MTVEQLLETSQVTIEDLRSIFAVSCKTWGLDQSTCLALTLLLNSRWALMLMIAWFHQEKEKGSQLTTTEIVLMAEKVRKAQDKRIELGMMV